MPLKRKTALPSKNNLTYYSLCSKVPSHCQFHENSTSLPSTKMQEKRDLNPQCCKKADNPDVLNCEETAEHLSKKTSVDLHPRSCELHRKEDSKEKRRCCQNNTKEVKNCMTSKQSGCDTNNCIENTDRRIKKTTIPHTDCKYCHNGINNIKEKPEKTFATHTDCKYCETMNGNKSSKTALPHTDCKYCLNNTDNVEEQLNSSADSETDSSIPSDATPDFNLLNDGRRISCCLHNEQFEDNLHIPQPHFYKPRSRKSFSYNNSANGCNICEYPTFCLVNEDYGDTYANFRANIRNDCHTHPFQKDGNYKSIKFRSCEFCLRNGQSDVIYNSHQFRNKLGIITCPILRQYVCPMCTEMNDFEHCSNNVEEIISTLNAMHIPNSVPYADYYTSNGCASGASLAAQNMPLNTTYSSHSLEMPNYYHTLPYSAYSSILDKDFLQAGSSRNFQKTNGIHEIHRNPSDGHEYDTQNYLAESSKHNIFDSNQSSDYLNQFLYSETLRKPKNNLSSLISEEPRLIYNSHQLRDKTGIALKCPILHNQDSVTFASSATHACNGFRNNSTRKAAHMSLVKGISNGSLNKRRYLDLLNCLI